MRLIAATAVAAASLSLLAGPSQAKPRKAAHPTAQAQHCTAEADEKALTGPDRIAFLKTCEGGVRPAAAPTGPTGASKEAQAVTRPSGVDRTTRSKQCSAEADRRGLAGKNRNAFRHSCLATAGPVTEGETGTQLPHPAHSIDGIGVNNTKAAAAPAKSRPAASAPEAVKPKP